LPLKIPEGDKFALESSGAPDMSGGTPDSPVRQTRGAFGCPFALLLNPIPDSPVRQTRGAFGCPFALLLNPILGLFIG
jgi:hypothetical protein